MCHSTARVVAGELEKESKRADDGFWITAFVSEALLELAQAARDSFAGFARVSVDGEVFEMCKVGRVSLRGSPDRLSLCAGHSEERVVEYVDWRKRACGRR